MEDDWKFSNGFDDVTEAVRFTGRSELFAIVCPVAKPSVEVWHTTEPDLGARIMRENKRSGPTRRTYLCGYRDPNGVDHKDKLDQFDEVDDDAQQLVRDKRRAREAPDAIKT